ncbi:RNA methyltransferase, TrmH family [Lentibacillus halodurans]|uniref:RNA methyltransferase, TrmH family n=1 Tax=Lentibacillus halodurans TaxID=237679 RepID=A0A1I0ZIT6_9BACI|nr:RNA methyltransferase [Lentibacillus halodurans]SFB24450.1 RNA methyltransferase, TrmH family [Lentibacillus halodurans]
MITSLQNTKVKQWMKLHKRKGRKQSGMFLIEGFHLIEEAYQSKWGINEIMIVEGLHYPDWCDHFSMTTVSRNVLQHITQTETPQGIAAVVSMRQPEEVMCHTALLIDSIQDPGNLGTMIRTADAAGFDKVILGNNTVDVYNDKVIRATQGSLFHLPIIQADLKAKIPELQAEGFSVWASSLEHAIALEQAEVTGKTALIVGNEGAGVRDELIRLVDQSVKIPIYGKAESLNVSVAAGILMYYIKR